MDRFEENGMKMNHIEEHLEKDRKTKRKFENYPCPSSSILLSNLTNSRVFAPKNKPNEGRIGEETNKNTLDKNSLDTPPQQRQRERETHKFKLAEGGSHEGMEKLKNLQTTQPAYRKIRNPSRPLFK